MFETIVWATDGSELADAALPYVIDVAREHRSRIVAVHAAEGRFGRYGGAPLLPDEPELRGKIERQVEGLREAGFDALLELPDEEGGLAHAIAEAAEKVGADLIVVGTHGHGAIAAALLGSVARGLLHAAHCPVLAVPPGGGALRREAETAAHA